MKRDAPLPTTAQGGRTYQERILTMVHDGRAIANFILDHCDQKGRPTTNLALQKIVYFCHVWSLVQFNRPLVKHKFEAWEFGPVLPYLYREFKNFDRLPVKSRATQIDPLDGSSRIVEYQFDPQTLVFLRDIVDFYSRMRASDLVELSHVAGGPWHQIWNHSGQVKPGMKIEDEQIASFYSKISCPFAVQ
jgi:uncharacterized phage-associated protein